MSNFSKLVVRVFRAYSLEEKVLSLIAFLVIGFTFAQSINVFFKGNKIFDDKSAITIGLISERAVVINPLYGDLNEANREVSRLIFSGLTKYDPQSKSFVGDLAEVKISEDKKQYDFTLKNNITWHDGQPVTADDIIFTYQLIQDPNFQNPILKANFDGIKFEKVDERTIRFALKNPNSFFITNLNVGILPKHLLDGVEVATLPSNTFNLKPVGTGPYKAVSNLDIFDDGREKIVLNVHDKYYSSLPRIREIKFLIYPYAEQLLKEKNSLNIIPKVSTNLASIFEDDQFVAVPYELPQYTAVFFNTEDPVLKNKMVRLALLKSLDKAQLIADLFNKTRVDTPLLELSQADWMFKPNVSEAQGAIFDSGYTFAKDKNGKVLEGEIYRKDKDGKVLELTLTARQYSEDSPLYVDTAKTIDFLVNEWRKIGVKVNVVFVDDTKFVEVLQIRDYQMLLAGQSLGYNFDTYPFWHSSQVNGVGLNISLYKSFGADQLIEKIRDSFDQTIKENRIKQLATVINEDVPAIFLYRPRYSLATDGKVKGIVLQNLAYINDKFANIADWCIECTM